jgi:hypothetical protein
MRRWFRIIVRLLILFALLSIIIYVFLPSNLSVQETIDVKCPPRLVFLKLADPNYWISRSKFFYNKANRFHIDSSKKGKPYIYRWNNKNGTAGFIQQKEVKRYESVIYQVSYKPKSEGELIFSLSYQNNITTIVADLEVDLPNSFMEKVKAYLWYISIKHNLRNELESLAMDCEMNYKPINLSIKKGMIHDFKAFISKSYVPKKRSVAIVGELHKMYESIPESTIVGRPFIQYANSPYNDTLILIIGVPIKNKEITRIPNYSLSLFSRVETLSATFNFREANIDDVYNQLVSKAKEMNLVADGYPLIFFNYKNGTATMQLPISR